MLVANKDVLVASRFVDDALFGYETVESAGRMAILAAIEADKRMETQGNAV